MNYQDEIDKLNRKINSRKREIKDGFLSTAALEVEIEDLERKKGVVLRFLELTSGKANNSAFTA